MTSHAVRQLLTSDMGHRYRADDRFYKGTRFLDEIEALGEKIACEVFGADWASLRRLSGHNADMLMVSTLAKPGASILSVSHVNGGYLGLSEQGYPPLVGVKNLYFPYDSGRMNIDADKAQGLIEDEKPSLVIFGQSFFLFPHPIKDLADSCRSVGASIAYDGSHVMGLIAGGAFQQPLKEGADLLLGSTHKSFFGPQGGIILGKAPLESAIRNQQTPGIIDNAHWNRIAALAWTLDEFRRKGTKYAGQVIENAKALARALHEKGVPVKCAEYGFTQSHQVILDICDENEVNRFIDALERANIITDRGIRLGTNEVTRRGMGPREMEGIADLIATVYKGGDVARVKRMSTRLRREFNFIQYT